MHIAIVALNAYAAINPSAGRQVGGLENFAWTLACALANQPQICVSMFVRHTRKVASKVVRGVHIVGTVERLRDVRRDVSTSLEIHSEFPWLRLRSWSSDLLYKVPLLAARRSFGPVQPIDLRLARMLDRSKPDLVLALGVSADSAAALRAARQRGISGILWVRSNMDLDDRLVIDPGFVSACGVRSVDFRECIEYSDAILCQTTWQLEQLKRLTELDSVIVRTPVDTNRFFPGSTTMSDRSGVLWIGRFDRFHKRPLLAIEIAERCPSLRFCMIINRGHADVQAEVLSRKPANVEVLDYVERDLMAEKYRQSRLFLSTGAFSAEGFPNVLLEAAASGTPIVSLEDFDQFMAKSQAGVVTGVDLDAAAMACRRLASSVDAWSHHSAAGPQYVGAEHSVNATVREFLTIADAVLESR